MIISSFVHGFSFPGPNGRRPVVHKQKDLHSTHPFTVDHDHVCSQLRQEKCYDSMHQYSSSVGAYVSAHSGVLVERG